MSGISQDQRDQAARHGRAAGRARRPVNDCPYSVNGSGQERALAAVWVRAYLDANPAARKKVDYTG